GRGDPSRRRGGSAPRGRSHSCVRTHGRRVAVVLGRPRRRDYLGPGDARPVRALSRRDQVQRQKSAILRARSLAAAQRPREPYAQPPGGARPARGAPGGPPALAPRTPRPSPRPPETPVTNLPRPERSGESPAALARVIVGKSDVLERILAGILANGHVLIEDYPGLAKTLIARLFAQALNLSFKRLQCTPDLLPADVTGSFLFD